MLKKVTVAAVLSLFVVSAGFAQPVRLSKQIHMKKADKFAAVDASFYTDYQNAKVAGAKKVNGAPLDLLFANYDWAYNSYHPQMLSSYDFDKDGSQNPVAIAVSVNPLRHTLFGFADAQGAYSFAVEGKDGTGKPYKTGSNSCMMFDQKTGKAYIGLYDFLTGNILREYVYEVDMIADPTTAKCLTDTAGYKDGGWARFCHLDNGEFWGIDNTTNDGNFKIMKSTDNGKFFNQVGVVGQGDAKYWFTELSNDPLIMSNGTKMSIFTTLARGGALQGYQSGTTVRDSANGLYHYYSTDAGATWQGEVVGLDGKINVSNRPTYLLAFTSYDVGNYVVDPTGVTHTVRCGVNSIGILHDGKDTSFVYPLYYWNDRDKNWIAVSDTATENDNMSNDALNWPGNMMGNNSPTVATSPDGKVVIITYMVPEYVGEPGKKDIEDIDIYPGDGGFNTTAVVQIDIYYVVSTDGGKTFSAPQPLVATKGEADYWPYIAHPLEVKDDKVIAHYLYFHDPAPGCFQVQKQNTASVDAVWRYNTLEIAYSGVNDKKNSTVTSFSVDQNYPNPFNPATTISYQMPERANVTLKVFDMLGREVAILVNGVQEAGNHAVSFNADKLTSGLYVYILSDGARLVSRKMMFLK